MKIGNECYFQTDAGGELLGTSVFPREFKPRLHQKIGQRNIVICKLVHLWFLAMSRSQSTPDIYKVTVTRANPKSVDEELLELCNLSGVTLDPDVFKILLDLIKLNVPPTSLVSVLKQIAATKGYRSEGHSVLTGKLSGGSMTASSYDTSSLSTGTGSSLTTSQSTRSERSERIPISSRLREMRAHAMQQWHGLQPKTMYLIYFWTPNIEDFSGIFVVPWKLRLL